MKFFVSATSIAIILMSFVACDKFEKTRGAGGGRQEGLSAGAIQVKALGNQVKSASAGFDHSCAVLTDDSIRCWGGNSRGQLGNGVREDRHPVPVEVLKPNENRSEWKEVSSGAYYTCGISSAGEVYCWGTLKEIATSTGTSGFRLSQMQIQPPRPNPNAPTPNPPVDPDDDENDSVPPGQRPNPGGPAAPNPGGPATPRPGGPVTPRPGGPVTPRPGGPTTPPTNPFANPPTPTVGPSPLDFGRVPKKWDGLSGFDKLSTNPKFACATGPRGRNGDSRQIKCWGTYFERLVNASGQPRLEPHTWRAPTDPQRTTWDTVQSVVVFQQNVCALRDNEVECLWDSPEDATQVSALASGDQHSCIVKTSFYPGEVWCTGNSRYKQAGEPETAPAPGAPPSARIQYYKIKGLSRNEAASDIALGTHHSCALIRNGTVRCWGRNDRGQLGSGSTGEPTSVPQTVKNSKGKLLRNVQHIFAGGNHTCALLTDKSLWCWGSNNLGQLGNP